jgi:hypothetical protein
VFYRKYVTAVISGDMDEKRASLVREMLVDSIVSGA